MIFMFSSKTIDTCFAIANDDVIQEIVNDIVYKEITTLFIMLAFVIFRKLKALKLQYQHVFHVVYNDVFDEKYVFRIFLSSNNLSDFFT